MFTLQSGRACKEINNSALVTYSKQSREIRIDIINAYYYYYYQINYLNVNFAPIRTCKSQLNRTEKLHLHIWAAAGA